MSDKTPSGAAPISRSLIGTWKLLTRVDRNRAGVQLAEPSLGSDPVALLVFDGSGNFAAQFMRRGPGAPAGDEGGAAPTNNSRARGGYDAYFGTYVTDDASGVVKTLLVGALSREYVGQEFIRHAAIEGDTLTLRLDTQSPHGEPVLRTLTWKRVG
jgi:hypothetical protein